MLAFPWLRFTGPVVIAMLLAVLTSLSNPSESEAEEDNSIFGMMTTMNALAKAAK